MESYYRNAVLCGQIDYYCLLCEESFTQTDQVERHIRWQKHRERRAQHPPHNKYKAHHITKIKDAFYCGVCNATVGARLAEVAAHVAGAEHAGRGAGPAAAGAAGAAAAGEAAARRTDAGVVLFGEFVCSERAWNGISGEQCLLCGAAAGGGAGGGAAGEGEARAHASQRPHLMRLIAARALRHSPDVVYREIDEGHLQCLTCNVGFVRAALAEHAADASHLCRLAASRLDSLSSVPAAAAAPPAPAPSAAPAAGDDVDAALGTNSYVYTAPGGRTQCLLCNWTLSKQSAIGHARGEHHRSLLRLQADVRRQRQEATRFREDAAGTGTAGLASGMDKLSISKKRLHDKTKSDIIANREKFEKREIAIDLERASARCLRCHTTLELTCEALEAHESFHRSLIDEVQAESAARGDGMFGLTWRQMSLAAGTAAAAAARAHGLLYKRQRSYCRACDVYVVSQVKCIEQHAGGARHRALGAPPPAPPAAPPSPAAPYASVRMSGYVRSVTTVRERRMFLINDRIHIDIHSFALCKLVRGERGRAVKCLACGECFAEVATRAHMALASHRARLDAARLIVTLPEQFVRELRPGVYHCGYCNELQPGWALLRRHLASSKHLENQVANMHVSRGAPDEGSDSDGAEGGDGGRDAAIINFLAHIAALRSL